MRQREETNGDRVAGHEVGVGVEIEVVHGDADREERVHKSTDEARFEGGK